MNNKYARWKDDRGDTGRVTKTVDEDTTSAVIRTVAICADRDPAALPPLNEVIDADALNAIFGPTPRGTPRPGGTLVFSYVGYRVQVTGSEEVSVEPIAHEE